MAILSPYKSPLYSATLLVARPRNLLVVVISSPEGENSTAPKLAGPGFFLLAPSKKRENMYCGGSMEGVEINFFVLIIQNVILYYHHKKFS